MSDLDDEELEATRKLNGVAKDSNIEEDKDVITLKNFIEIFNERKTKGDIATIDVLGEEIHSLENILAKRETDKKKIAELEEKLELIDLRKIKIELKMYKDFVTNRGIKAEFDMWKKVKVEEER